MSGKKGRSGRKSIEQEFGKYRIISKAWRKVNRKLDMTDKQAYDIAGSMVVKDMTAKEEVKSDVTLSATEQAEVNAIYDRLKSKELTRN
jgi:hypothetical protein